VSKLKGLMTSTAGGKVGAIDGLNLFFGALLGANLGTVDRMPLTSYLMLIFLLAGTVMTLRMVSTSEKRTQMFVTLALYVGAIFAVLLLPALQPKGMEKGDLHRLIVTLVVWIFFVVASELMPVKAPSAESPPT